MSFIAFECVLSDIDNDTLKVYWIVLILLSLTVLFILIIWIPSTNNKSYRHIYDKLNE